MRLLIIHHYSTNVGDRAVLYAVLRELARLGVEAVTVSANNPNCFPSLDVPSGIVADIVTYGWDTKRTSERSLPGKVIPGLHNRLFPRVAFPLLRAKVLRTPGSSLVPTWCAGRFRRVLRQADAVISTGGHHLTSILAADCVYPQTFDYAMVIRERKPLYLWSQSIGPCSFANPSNQALVQRILQSSSAIYLRDIQSLAHVEAIQGSMRNVHRTFESVFMLADALPGLRAEATPPKIGVAVYAVKRRTRDELAEYVRTMQGVCRLAISRGFRIAFFPMDLDGGDHQILGSIMSDLPSGLFEVSWEYEGILQRLTRIRACRAFVGHKTHSVVFSLLCGTPVVALAYHPKTEDFMAQFGLSEFCVPESGLTEVRVCDALGRLLHVLDKVSEQQRAVAASLGAKVRCDFEGMFSQITSVCGTN